MVLAHHLILMGYGHWLPNDPRGSWSSKVESDRLKELGKPHWGRNKVQPSKDQLREFHQCAERELAYPQLWLDPLQRAMIAGAVGEVIAEHKLTCWACALLPNHAHLLVRAHRLEGEQMLALFKDRARKMLANRSFAPSDHPVFSAAKGDVFKYTPAEIRSCITYIWDNFRKHRVPPQRYPFVTEYDGWPLKGRSSR
jgi:REP element-mobilizing transposase RayT